LLGAIENVAAFPSRRGYRSSSRARGGSRALVFAEYFPPYMGSDRRLFDLMSNIQEWQVDVAVVPPLRVLICGEGTEEALRLRLEYHSGSAVTVPESCARDRDVYYLKLTASLRRLWNVGFSPLAFACTVPNLIIQAVKLIRRSKPDVVVAGHPSYLCGLVAVLAARLAGVPVLLDYPDAWTPLAIETAGLRPLGLTARILYALEAFIAGQADRITSITAELADYVRNTMKAEAPITIVGNGGDDGVFVWDTPPADRASFNIPSDHTVVVYSGRLESWSGAAALVETVKLVVARRQKTTFLIIGDGNAAQTLRQAVRAEELEAHVVFLGYRPFAEMPQLIALADLAIIPFPRTPTTDVCAPIKLYEYMLMKKAIITTELRGIRESVSEEHVHFISDLEAQTLAGAILELVDDTDRRRDLAHRAYELATARLTWRSIAVEFSAEMRKTVDGLPAPRRERAAALRRHATVE
jgi:glycosyltransferase involved in cell wall biosynthesis